MAGFPGIRISPIRPSSHKFGYEVYDPGIKTIATLTANNPEPPFNAFSGLEAPIPVAQRVAEETPLSLAAQDFMIAGLIDRKLDPADSSEAVKM